MCDKHRQKGRGKKQGNVTIKPEVVIVYNRRLVGVDKIYQQLASFLILMRCCVKTYKALLFYILDFPFSTPIPCTRNWLRRGWNVMNSDCWLLSNFWKQWHCQIAIQEVSLCKSMRCDCKQHNGLTSPRYITQSTIRLFGLLFCKFHRNYILILNNNGTGTQSQWNKYKKCHWIQYCTSSTYLPSLSLCVRSILVLSFHLSSLLHGFATEIMLETKMLFFSNFSYLIVFHYSSELYVVL